MRKFFTFLFILFYCSLQAQQTYFIKGVVLSSDDRSPLPGATIRVQGTGAVAQTGKDGNFRIAVPREKGILTASFLGFQSAELAFTTVGERAITIYLKPQSNTLNETLVIAYGKTSRRFNTGSVAKVGAAEISAQPVANPLAALQGRVAGVEITQQSGRTGSNFNILIRGRSSIDNGNEPFFLIDGVPWLSSSISQIAGSAGSQSPFNSINPSDIESIEVLKDADATAIYGSRGANGVILITTKKGRAGKTEVGFNAYTGFSGVGHVMPLMNTGQYLEMRKEAFANDGIVPTNTNAPDLLLYDQQRYTDWKDVLIGNRANLTDIQTSLSGGNSNTQFRLAGAFRRETNVYPGDNADKRGSGQLSLNHRSGNQRLNASFSLNYSSDDNSLPAFDLTSGIYAAPNLKVYEDDGSLAWNENGSANRNNPMSPVLTSFNTLTNNLVSNLNAGYEVVKGLQVKVNAGYTNTQVQETNVFPLDSYLPSSSRKSGESKFASTFFRSWLVEPQVSYAGTYGDHSIDILLGAGWQQEKLQGTSISASNYSSEALLFTTAGAATLSASENYSLYKYQSAFGRINYQFKRRYLLNLTGRRDGSSRFGPDHQFSNFGAVGAAWIFSEEGFVKRALPLLSFGKLRGSYGITGNDKIGNYQFMDTYGKTSYPYNGVSGLAPQRLFNPNYSWESNRKLELALETSFFKDRIFLSAGWYRNRSSSQLLQYTLPAQTGFSGITRNLPATVENRGWEFGLNTVNLQGKAFSWNTSFNLTIPRNELISFPGLETSSYASRFAIGESLNIIKVYSYLGVDAETGLWKTDVAAGSNVVRDLGSRLYGGLSNTLTYKGIKLDLFFQFVRKDARNYLYSLPTFAGGTSNMPVAVEGRWQKDSGPAEIQRYGTTGAVSTARANYLLSDGVFTDASFIRLKNAALSYTVPLKWLSRLRATGARIYVQGQNLFTITGYEGNDPETASMLTLPPLRTITIGTQFSF